MQWDVAEEGSRRCIERLRAVVYKLVIVIQVETIFTKYCIVITIGDIWYTKQGLLEAGICEGMGGERDTCRRDCNRTDADGWSDLAVRETDSKWLIGCLDLKLGGNCVRFANENAIETSVGSGGGRMNFNVYSWGHGQKRRSRRSNVWIGFSLTFIKVLADNFLLRWFLTVLTLWPDRQPRTLGLPPAGVRWSVAARCCAVYCFCALALRTLQSAPMWLFW